LNAPVPEFLNKSALVLRRSSIITASDTLASGTSTRVSATIGGLSTRLLLVRDRLEDGVAGVGIDLAQRRNRRTVPILETAHVATELRFHALGRLIEGGMRLITLARPLEDHALHDVRDDIAGKAAMRSVTEGDVCRNAARKIFISNRLETILDMDAQRVAGVDLMARDPDVHFHLLLAHAT
jgi:hypothetical protein